jgi:hypothetical protein
VLQGLLRHLGIPAVAERMPDFTGVSTGFRHLVSKRFGRAVDSDRAGTHDG